MSDRLALFRTKRIVFSASRPKPDQVQSEESRPSQVVQQLRQSMDQMSESTWRLWKATHCPEFLLALQLPEPDY